MFFQQKSNYNRKKDDSDPCSLRKVVRFCILYPMVYNVPNFSKFDLPAIFDGPLAQVLIKTCAKGPSKMDFFGHFDEVFDEGTTFLGSNWLSGPGRPLLAGPLAHVLIKTCAKGPEIFEVKIGQKTSKMASPLKNDQIFFFSNIDRNMFPNRILLN
jgi:hypothetical protein